MSYDLYFDREEELTKEAFFAYFEKRPRFKLSEREALYQSVATGVHFMFSFFGEARQGTGESRAQASFNLNFCRPRSFGAEASIVLKSFVEHFGFAVRDPQAEYHGRFSKDRFLDSWNRGNEMICRTLLNQPNNREKLLTRPTSELEGIWRWNYRCGRIQADLGSTILVATIAWMKIDGVLYSCSMWPDGIATLLPATEKIFIPRSVIPREIAQPQVKAGPLKDVCIIDPGVLDEYLPPIEQGDYPLPCRKPDYITRPDKIRNFIDGLTPVLQQVERIPMDRVFDADLLLASREER